MFIWAVIDWPTIKVPTYMPSLLVNSHVESIIMLVCCTHSRLFTCLLRLLQSLLRLCRTALDPNMFRLVHVLGVVLSLVNI